MQVIGILGSTGSIGKQALDIVRLNKSYQIEYLSCFSQVDEIINQAKEFHPKKICIIDKSKESILTDTFKNEDIEILSGFEGLIEISKTNVDFMLNAIVGADGMKPSIIALENVMAKAKSIKAMASSKATIPRSTRLNFPFSCNSCITAIVAAGAVAAGSDGGPEPLLLRPPRCWKHAQRPRSLLRPEHRQRRDGRWWGYAWPWPGGAGGGGRRADKERSRIGEGGT